MFHFHSKLIDLLENELPRTDDFACVVSREKRTSIACGLIIIPLVAFAVEHLNKST